MLIVHSLSYILVALCTTKTKMSYENVNVFTIEHGVYNNVSLEHEQKKRKILQKSGKSYYYHKKRIYPNDMYKLALVQVHIEERERFAVEILKSIYDQHSLDFSIVEVINEGKNIQLIPGKERVRKLSPSPSSNIFKHTINDSCVESNEETSDEADFNIYSELDSDTENDSDSESNEELNTDTDSEIGVLERNKKRVFIQKRVSSSDKNFKYLLDNMIRHAYPVWSIENDKIRDKHTFTIFAILETLNDKTLGNQTIINIVKGRLDSYIVKFEEMLYLDKKRLNIVCVNKRFYLTHEEWDGFKILKMLFDCNNEKEETDDINESNMIDIKDYKLISKVYSKEFEMANDKDTRKQFHSDFVITLVKAIQASNIHSFVGYKTEDTEYVEFLYLNFWLLRRHEVYDELIMQYDEDIHNNWLCLEEVPDVMDKYDRTTLIPAKEYMKLVKKYKK